MFQMHVDVNSGETADVEGVLELSGLLLHASSR
jgi:hypothetical protein